MELTAEQQAIVEHGEGPLRVTGRAATGKTTGLRRRYLRLVEAHPASRVLVVCRDRAAANRLRDAVLPALSGGFDTLPLSTFHAVAYDVVVRRDGPVQLLTRGRRRALIHEMLAGEGADEWPTLHAYLGRRAFVDAVSRAVLALQQAPLSDDEVVTRADAAGGGHEWRQILAFRHRYLAALGRRRLVDAPGLLARAVQLLDDATTVRQERSRYDHVLVDDYETATALSDALLSRLPGPGANLVVAGNSEAAVAGGGRHRVHLDTFVSRFAAVGDVALTRPFDVAAVRQLVRCDHPAMEPEAVAGELLAAHGAGVPWSDMAVLVRRPAQRARAINRALARHGIPVAPLPVAVTREPAVQALIDVLRWVHGDERAFDRLLVSPVSGLTPAEVRSVRRECARRGIPVAEHPRLEELTRLGDDLRRRAADAGLAELAFEVWQRALGHLVSGRQAPGEGVERDGLGPVDDRALDALVAFLDGLASADEEAPATTAGVTATFDALDDALEPEPWRAVTPVAPEGVTVASIVSAGGQRWHTVVLSGCVEGELPHITGPPSLFDLEILNRATPLTAAERRRQSLADERSLFFEVACTRAARRLVATAAPEPGVLLSRFVEGWPQQAPRLPLAPGRAPVTRQVTAGVAPVAVDGRLRLSATQLATYDDCPLRYAYEYVVGVRHDAGVYAGLGSLVHEVLQEFLDPAAPEPVPRTKEALLALGERRWRDDIAPYRPQVEEARRDFFTMLDDWWEGEGGLGEQGPQVLATERRFDIGVGPHRLTGCIDRIDRADDGEGIRIVDYKTGSAEPGRRGVEDDLQLAVYHLAATHDPELAALGPPTQLRLLYLRSMHAYEQAVTPDHAAATAQRVLDIAGRIVAEDFEPSVEANCRICAFHRLCPLQPEGRQWSDAVEAGAP